MSWASSSLSNARDAPVQKPGSIWRNVLTSTVFATLFPCWFSRSNWAPASAKLCAHILTHSDYSVFRLLKKPLQSLHQAALPAGILHLSRSLPGNPGTPGNLHGTELQNLFRHLRKGGIVLDTPTIIRIAAGVLFVVVLVFLIQRRRTKVK